MTSIPASDDTVTSTAISPETAVPVEAPGGADASGASDAPDAPGSPDAADSTKPAGPSLWHNRDYLLLMSGKTTQIIGSGFATFAVPLIAFALTQSVFQAGLISALGAIGYVVATLPAGAIADRVDRRRLLILCSAIDFILLASLVAAIATSTLTVWHLTLVLFFSAIVADQVCLAWGIDHTHYHVATVLGPVMGGSLAPFVVSIALQAVLAGAAFGLVSLIFSESIHGLQHLFREWVPWNLARPVVGGLMVIGLVWLTGTRDYLGLGVDSANPEVVTIVRAFEPGGAHTWSWAAKLLFTVVTLASGFKGGEVTPLFFIGATLGNTLAVAVGAPVDLFAALGFLAVFAGATNTPIACTVMGVELFGGQYLVYYAIACTTAYLFSGHSGIYLSQRVAHPKGNASAAELEETLRARRAKSPVFSRRIVTKPTPPKDVE